MQAEGGEPELLRAQFKARASIFACDDFAVISARSESLGEDECGNAVQTWVNDLPMVPMGQLGAPGVATASYLNTKTFLMAWETLMNSGKIWPHDFVVKADPDCVFFPDRLRRHALPYKGSSTFFLNCQMQGDKLFGALEVFSVAALRQYQSQVYVCRNNLHWHGWGEDLYMEQCMKLMGVQGTVDVDLVGDDRCRAAPCGDFSRVAYHPFKDIKGWKRCHDESSTAEQAANPDWHQTLNYA